MLLAATRSLRVLWVGGKGGVGKTSVSSGLALAHAEAGDRVLLVSTDPAHNLGHLWGRALDGEPQTVFTHAEGVVDAVEIDPQKTVDEHLRSVGEMMEFLLPERMQKHARQHLALAREAPGTHESAVLERVADFVTLGLERYDRVIFDTAPTGHTLRLLSLPAQLTGWTETLLKNRDRSERFTAAMRGLTSVKDAPPGDDAERRLRQTLERRRHRFASLHDTLRDPSVSGFLVALTPERIPVAESIELIASLEATSLSVTAVVVNRRSPQSEDPVYHARHEREGELLRELRASIPGVPLVEIPLLAEEPLGATGLQLLGNHFGADHDARGSA